MSGAGFLLDLHRCVGCGACVLACRIENGRVETAAWRRVLPLNLRRRPGRPHVLPVGRLPPLRRAGVPEGLPLGRLRETRRRHRRAPRGAVPRVPVLRDDVPVRHAAIRRSEGRDVEVPPVRASRGRGPAAGLRGRLSDRGAAVRGRDGSASGRRAETACRDSPTRRGAGPALRFLPPAGARRAELFRLLEEALKR